MRLDTDPTNVLSPQISEVIITNMKHSDASEAGKYGYYTVSYKVLSGEDAGAEFNDLLSLSPKALWKIKDFISFWMGEFVPKKDYPEDNFIGLTGKVEIDINEYQGRKNNTVKKFISLTSENQPQEFD